MHGLRADMTDVKHLIATNAKQSAFQDRANTNAIDKLTAAVDRFTSKAERAMRLNREVGHEIADGVVKEVTGQFKLQKADADSDNDEITGGHIKVRWSTLAKYAPVAAKVFGVLAVAAGAVWATLERLAKYLPGHH